MKLHLMKTADDLYTAMQCEENSDTSMPSEEPRRAFYSFCKLNNLNVHDVKLFNQVTFYYHHQIREQMAQVELDVLANFHLKLAKYYDEKNETRTATRLIELASELEV